MAQVSRPSILFEIRQGFPPVMGGAPRRPQLGQCQGLNCPHCPPAFVFSSAPPAHPPREWQSAQGKEVMRPLPPSRKGEGRLQEARFPSFTIQLPAARVRPAVPAIPTQSSPFSTPGGDPVLNFPQVLSCQGSSLCQPPGQRLGDCRGQGAGHRLWSWQRPQLP